MQKIKIRKKDALALDKFREMDYYAVEEFGFPIELMMENAGLQLAMLIALHARNKKAKILIGVGNGNNGGGGLVAARRLSAWGYNVFLDPFVIIDKDLPRLQYERALKFGAKEGDPVIPDIWVDAYLGFSQKLPLGDNLKETITLANASDAIRIALDLPTGFTEDKQEFYFHADQVLTLAAPKKLLFKLLKADIFVADIGIPKVVYEKFDVEMPPFQKGSILKLAREIYVHEHVKIVQDWNAKTLAPANRSKNLRKFISSYAEQLEKGHQKRKASASIDLSNYYKPLIGKNPDEIFAAKMSKGDFLDAAAFVHGFDRFDLIPDREIDLEFEAALDLLLAGEYHELKKMLDKDSELVKQASHFGHQAQLIHYCASNAVEIYRQVVPENLLPMIELLIGYGAEPTAKIPVYGGMFDFFELFTSSAHPKAAGVDEEVMRFFEGQWRGQGV